jgi:hypothetical protein
MNSIFAETGKDVHLYSFVIASENSREAFSERNNSTIEYTV